MCLGSRDGESKVGALGAENMTLVGTRGTVLSSQTYRFSFFFTDFKNFTTRVGGYDSDEPPT
jgi:hypothetical protein